MNSSLPLIGKSLKINYRNSVIYWHYFSYSLNMSSFFQKEFLIIYHLILVIESYIYPTYIYIPFNVYLFTFYNIIYRLLLIQRATLFL